MHPNHPPPRGPYPGYDHPPAPAADPAATYPNAPHHAAHSPHGPSPHPAPEPGNGHAATARQPQQVPTPGDFCPIGAAWIKPGQSGFYTNFVWKGPDFVFSHGSVINIFPNDRKQPGSNQPDFLLSCKIPTASGTTATTRTPSAQQFMQGPGPAPPTHSPDPPHTPHPAYTHGDPNAAPHPAYTHADPAAAPHPAYTHSDPHAAPHPAYIHGDPHAAPHPVYTHGDPHTGPSHPGGPGTPYTEPPRGTHHPDFPAGPTPGLDADTGTHSPAPSELPGNPIHDPSGTATAIAPGAPPPPPTTAPSAGAPPAPPFRPHNGAPPGPHHAPPGASHEDLIPE